MIIEEFKGYRVILSPSDIENIKGGEKLTAKYVNGFDLEITFAY